MSMQQKASVFFLLQSADIGDLLKMLNKMTPLYKKKKILNLDILLGVCCTVFLPISVLHFPFHMESLIHKIFVSHFRS